jgi:tetratricopeptide (TPR) repeat protein
MKGIKISLLISFSVFTFLSSAVLQAGEGTSKVQLIRLKNMMTGGDYAAAYRALRDLEKSDSTTAELYSISGECNFHLKNYPEALERLQRSIKLNPQENIEKYFYLARTYQFLGNLQEAANAYQQFIEKQLKKSDEKEAAVIFLDQCRRSIEMMKNPVNVKLNNLGEKVNSEYPEYNPSISADGNTLIFTTRRPENTGKYQDPEDGKFYEDIYISQRDSISGNWSEAIPVEGKLNTDAHDANMALSPDGSQIYVYRNSTYGSGEIYVSKQGKTGKWGEAKKVEGDINTSYFESSASVSSDGKTLYFVSERPKGGFGMGDIYKSKRISKTEWGKAENLGNVINDEYDQIGVFIHPDGKTLYFSSNSPQSLGGYDIYKSTLENGKWTKPQNLGFPINTTGDERFFSLSTDGKTAWFSSNRNGGLGDLDLWEIDFTDLVAETSSKEIEVQTLKGPILSIISGKIIDSDAGQTIETDILITEKATGKQIQASSDENGYYFSTLEGDKDYSISINNPLYNSYTFDFFLKTLEKGTYTLEKIIVLNRIKK